MQPGDTKLEAADEFVREVIRIRKDIPYGAINETSIFKPLPDSSS